MDHHSDDRLRAALGARTAPDLSPDLVTSAPERPEPRLVANRRRVLAGGAAGIAVAAVTVGALVVTMPGTPQAPLFTAAGAPGAAGASTLGDERLMLWVDREYVAGPSLSTAGGTGHVYELQRSGTPEAVAALAAETFGVAGEATESQYSSPDYPTWVVGPEDGSGPTVSVSWSGPGDWWFSDPTAYPAPDAAPGDNLAPTADEAPALAEELLGAMGLEVAAADIRVTADEWGTSATANLVVDGTATALEWGVTWSTTGAVASAYGHSVEVVDRGSYGTVSAASAVERLADGRWFGSPGPDFQTMTLYAADTLARDGVAEDAPTEEAPAEEAPAEQVPTEQVPAEEVPAEEMPSEEAPLEETPTPEPTPETVTITLDASEATLLLMWDADGNAWLVPGYAYALADGGYTCVVSLVDGVITMPEPASVDPLV